MNDRERVIEEQRRRRLEQLEQEAQRAYELQVRFPQLVRETAIEVAARALDEADDLEEARELLAELEPDDGEGSR